MVLYKGKVKDRLITDMKKQMGLLDTWINPEITTVKDLVIQMRHCVARIGLAFKFLFV